VEARRGTSTEASTYCKKDGQFVEWGTISKSNGGSRSDLIAVHAAINSGKSLRMVSNEFFGTYLRYERGLRSYMLLHGQRTREPPSVRVLWGATGTGKTRRVHETHDPDTIYAWPGCGLWFDGYDGEPVALLDDFTGSCMPLAYLLKLLDRYPFRVPIKGGYTNWLPTIIYLTSNIDPDQWYPNAHLEHQRALKRRFTSVEHFQNI